MKKLVLAALIASAPFISFAQPKIDQAAPSFNEKDSTGKSHQLSDFKGKWVVLEWYNKDCPYVKKHYDSQNMQKLQAEYTGKGVVWVSVISSAPGKQGYLTAAQAEEVRAKAGSKASAIIIDEDGNMGKAYDAKTTPHMYVINPEGQLVYMGAIDSNDSSNPKVIPESENYVKAALDAGMNKQPIKTKVTKAYGCSVKY